MAKEKYSVEQIVAALRDAKGMIYVAARNLGCSANTIYGYVRRYATVREALDQERGLLVDTAELALWRAVQNGEGWAISLTLKTIGKDRGYVERQEVSGPGAVPLTVKVVWENELDDKDVDS